MTYAQALDYLYSRLPVFHRIGPKALKPGLDNTLRLCEALGNPQHRFKSIHVAGTNGKGSSSHMLAAVYQQAGYRVGLYTSPHLKSFTERIRLNGQPIPEVEVAGFVEKHRGLIEAVEPSFFEVTVAMAFDYFARQQPDIAIIEVGLGGRLDSTNVITPLASLITNIGFDHMDVLGDTLPQIAREKAGIIKPGVPVVISETHAESAPVFERVALANYAPITFADQQYTCSDAGITDGYRTVIINQQRIAKEHELQRNHKPQRLSVQLDLTGAYQVRNVAGVVATVNVLQPQLPVNTFALTGGLAVVGKLTGLKGRFQTLQERPRVVADTAHNQPGLEALIGAVETLTYQNLHIVLGMVADKEPGKLIHLLPASATYYFCQAQTPRSLPAEVLRTEAAAFGRMGVAYPDVNAAKAAALQQATPEDLILITGSNYIVAELTDL